MKLNTFCKKSGLPAVGSDLRIIPDASGSGRRRQEHQQCRKGRCPPADHAAGHQSGMQHRNGVRHRQGRRSAAVFW